jgi:hypothetical protein
VYEWRVVSSRTTFAAIAKATWVAAGRFQGGQAGPVRCRAAQEDLPATLPRTTPRPLAGRSGAVNPNQPHIDGRYRAGQMTMHDVARSMGLQPPVTYSDEALDDVEAIMVEINQ